MMADEEQYAMLKALAALDNGNDSGISFDVKTNKGNKFQNVKVNIPAWVFAVGAVLGGATALILINEVVKELTGQSLFPQREEGEEAWYEKKGPMGVLPAWATPAGALSTLL
jgi:membrane protein YqaA with SNARE-associated domain